MSATADRPDLASLRDRPWRSLDEAADSPEFRRWLDAEFPSLADLAYRGPDRRSVLKLMAAAFGLSGLAACRPEENILPYVVQPERTTPGLARLYATTLASEGWGMGVVVTTREGRPIKIEGNPDHPASRGATDAVMQAAVLSLYDPERLRSPRYLGEPAAWGEWRGAVAGLRDRLRPSGGAGLALLLEPTTSPTLNRLVEALRGEYPAMRVYEHAPLGRDPLPEAARRLWGRPLAAVWRLDRARRVLTLDADVLAEGPGRLAYARDFIDGRRVRGPEDGMSRLWAVESTPTITGAKADERRAVRPSEVLPMARALLAAVEGGAVPDDAPQADWLRRAARDLLAAGPEALAIPGEHQPPEGAEAALRINARLGSLSRAALLIEPSLPEPAEGDLSALAQAIEGGKVRHLLSLAPDPVGTAPGGLDLAAALGRLETFHHWTLHPDATSPFAHWLLPAAHDLEAWGDLRAFDGTASLQQPMIQPLYEGRTALEVLAAWGGRYDLSAQDILRANWPGLDDRAWAGVLQRGVVEGTAAAPVEVPAPAPPAPVADPESPAGLELRLVPDPFLRDGRHANNAWLQELPRPLTKIVWGNAALLSSRTAGDLGLANDDEALLRLDGRELRTRVWIVPGHPDGTVTLSLGYGQGEGSVAGMARGANAFALRHAGEWFATGLEIEPAGPGGVPVLTTQEHGSMEGRDIVRHASLKEFQEDPTSASRPIRPSRSIPTGTIPAKAGGCPWTSPPASAAWPASPPARARTTSPPSAPPKWSAGTRCTGSAWTATTRAPRRRPRRCSSPSPACTARRPPARPSARSTPRCTPMTGSTRRSTTAASAPATARRTAPTRCGASTGANTPTSSSPWTRRRTGGTPRSRCARAG
ncbi:Fe-S-cluster-containing hydrogenase component 1 [Rubellimicrobium mesophilum DSM 19309]|uniref:Fe-S-cluster-containing hydrogenase component 1 n=1 Tax=Rubellimicrobium mesophilum DSM 19309 TaxID=442562 RepID=A0A017HIF6_9RHOB|nr:TAT-variant-translocated molybdopterin oxidoreductase [Rubellimicrobium mesophilum]EYD73943.1 Fe-S-cluster-containing hydrogenase component 1 [Rubellimicrobium mesophilum DSM 19309]